MSIDWNQNHAAIWRQQKQALRPVTAIDPIALDTLVGIGQQIDELTRNTERFEDDGITVLDSEDVAYFCSRQCCDRAMGALPFYTPAHGGAAASL